MALSDFVGWVGSAFCLVAYFLLSTRRVSDEHRGYQAMNFVGAALLGVNVYAQKAWPMVFVEVGWSGIALAALIRLCRGRRSA